MKGRIKTEQGKLILQHASKLLLQKRIHLNHVICIRLEKSIKQLKDKIKKSIASEEFHFAEKYQENSHEVFWFYNCNQNTKGLSKVAIVKRMKLRNTVTKITTLSRIERVFDSLLRC